MKKKKDYFTMSKDKVIIDKENDTFKWVVFYYDGKDILKFTIDGIMTGEIQATKELLSYEKNIPISKILTRLAK